MQALRINGTKNSPSVTFDLTNNLFMIGGTSRPENAVAFYAPAIKWLSDLEAWVDKNTEELKPMIFNFNFEYINSVSVKILFDIFKLLQQINTKSKNIEVNWYFKKGDVDMKETGEEYQKLLTIPFSVITEEIKS